MDATHIVMPTKSLPQAKAGVGIHGFPWRAQQSRGWRAFARHDGGRVSLTGVWYDMLPDGSRSLETLYQAPGTT